MRASVSFAATLLLAVLLATLHSRGTTTQAAPCDAYEAWEALEVVYNSTGNLTDAGSNRTTGGAGSRGDMNDTSSRNATIPMPNGTAVPSPTESPRSAADFAFTTKMAGATLAMVVLLLTA